MITPKNYNHNKSGNTYAIGDVQGCFAGLMELLEKIDFNPRIDKLIFLGDVVNRGDKSLQTLDFIYKNNHQMVLGNHDYHLLACYFGINKPNRKDTFLDILQSKNSKNLIEFLLNQDIVLYQNNSFFVHAGLPHIFCKKQILETNIEIKENLSKDPEKFIKTTFGNQNIYLNNNKNLQMQYAINGFMRMRFCTENGELNFTHKQTKRPKNFKPWFEFENQLLTTNKIYFGHWSALKNTNIKNIYPMDTGYVWGGELSCIRLEDNKVFSVNSL